MLRRRLANLLSFRAQFGFIVLALALALRLALVPTARFTNDEARAWAEAVDIANGAGMPLLGQPVTGGPARVPGPFVPWTLALSQVGGASPERAYALVALLGSLAVLVTWHALRRPFGEAGALAVGLLLATSPWSTLYSVSTLTVSLVALPCAVAILAVVRLRERPTPGWTAVLMAAAALLPQAHLSAPALWAALGVLVLPVLGRLPRRGVLAGVALTGLFYAPMLVHELRTGWQNAHALMHGPAGGASGPGVERLLLQTAHLLTLDTSHRELLGDWTGLRPGDLLAAFWHGTPLRPAEPFAVSARVLSAVLALAVVGSWAATLLRSPWRRRAPSPEPRALPDEARGFAWAALAGVATAAGLLALSGREAAPHYVQPLLPFLLAPVAPLVAHAMRGPRAARAVVWGTLGLVAVGGVEASLAVSRRVDAPRGLAVQRRVAQWLVVEADTLPRPVDLDVRVDPAGPREPWPLGHVVHLVLGIDVRVTSAREPPTLILARPGDPPPPGYALTLDAGAALLYRRSSENAP
jgi:hypothetical protein